MHRVSGRSFSIGNHLIKRKNSVCYCNPIGDICQWAASGRGQYVPGWVRVVTPLGVLGIGGKSPHARHGRFPSSPQLNCAYSASGESPRTMRYGRWRWSYILWAPRPEPLKNTFPRREGGRAYARSDEKRRNVPIMSAVHKKGTILKAVPSYLTALYVVSCRHSSSAPSGAPSPLGKVLLR